MKYSSFVGLSLMLAILLGGLVLSTSTVRADDELDPSEVEALLQEARDAIPDVEKLRGLEFKFDVEMGVKTREATREFIFGEFDSDEMQDSLRRARVAMLKIGIIAEDLDLGAAVRKVYGDSIGGFYDPDTQSLNLVKTDAENMSEAERMNEMQMRMMGLSAAQAVMVHELTHALDDQHFDMLNIVDRELADSDTEMAMTCLLEGVAEGVKYDWMLQNFGSSSWNNPMIEQQLGAPTDDMLGDMEGVPGFLIKTLAVPYALGPKFVIFARKADKGDWGRINAAYENLPASMEQILHPEKYFGTEAQLDYPVVFELPDYVALLGEGWEEIDNDNFGEYQIRALYEDLNKGQRSGTPNAIRASEGWDGDRYAIVYDTQGEEFPGFDQPVDANRCLFVWRSRWDTANDAKEFFTEYVNTLRNKYKVAPDTATGTSERAVELADGTTVKEIDYSFEAEGRMVTIRRRDVDVLLIESAPKDKLAAILDSTWAVEAKAWSRPPRDDEVPSIDRSAPRGLESENYTDGVYTMAETGWSVSVPHDGLALVGESFSDNYVQFTAEDETHEEIFVGWRATTADSHEATWEEIRAMARMDCENAKPVLPSKAFTTDADQRAWKEIFRASMPSEDFDRIYVLVGVLVDDNTMIGIRVSAHSDHLKRVSDDATALINSLAKVD